VTSSWFFIRQLLPRKFYYATNFILDEATGLHFLTSYRAK